MDSGKADMAIGTQKVERRLGDVYTREFPSVSGIIGNFVDAQQVAEARQPAWGRVLPDHDQIESRVVEFCEQVFGGTMRLELESQPGETVAGARRSTRQADRR